MGINQVSGPAATYVTQEGPNRAPKVSVADRRVASAPTADANTSPQSQTGAAQISHRQIEESIQRIRESLKSVANNNLEFSVDDITGQTVVKVIDSSTKELIRQIPSEEMLAIAQALEGEIKGLLVRNTA